MWLQESYFREDSDDDEQPQQQPGGPDGRQAKPATPCACFYKLKAFAAGVPVAAPCAFCRPCCLKVGTGSWGGGCCRLLGVQGPR